MPHEITRIDAGANCYLIGTAAGFLMIDSGYATKRRELESELERAGCKSGSLQLILLTHGDPDHSGNARYLREKYGGEIAMHGADFAMVEIGDINSNRKPKPDRISPIMRVLTLFVSRLSKAPDFEKFTPDQAIDEDFDLVVYGFDAKVLHLPGHSKGSIGILTGAGEFFCGDLIYNLPGFYYYDDAHDFNASLEKIKKYAIHIVYPGHGRPFPPEKKIKGYRQP